MIVPCCFEIKWSLSFLANVFGGNFLRDGGILAQITGPVTFIAFLPRERLVGWMNSSNLHLVGKSLRRNHFVTRSLATFFFPIIFLDELNENKLQYLEIASFPNLFTHTSTWYIEHLQIYLLHAPSISLLIGEIIIKNCIEIHPSLIRRTFWMM